MDRTLARGFGLSVSIARALLLGALWLGALLLGVPAGDADAQVLPSPTPNPSSAAASRPFRPPTTRAVSRAFDMTNGTYGAGNRGLDYAVQPGDSIRAIGKGSVVFAGTVAGERYVTILHPDGLRSSYSYLATISVSVGAAVSVGDVIGTSSARFQLGIRRGSTYLDPAPLLGRDGPPTRARLVRGPRV